VLSFACGLPTVPQYSRIEQPASPNDGSNTQKDASTESDLKAMRWRAAALSERVPTQAGAVLLPSLTRLIRPAGVRLKQALASIGEKHGFIQSMLPHLPDTSPKLPPAHTSLSPAVPESSLLLVEDDAIGIAEVGLKRFGHKCGGTDLEQTASSHVSAPALLTTSPSRDPVRLHLTTTSPQEVKPENAKSAAFFFQMQQDQVEEGYDNEQQQQQQQQNQQNQDISSKGEDQAMASFNLLNNSDSDVLSETAYSEDVMARAQYSVEDLLDGNESTSSTMTTNANGTSPWDVESLAFEQPPTLVMPSPPQRSDVVYEGKLRQVLADKDVSEFISAAAAGDNFSNLFIHHGVLLVALFCMGIVAALLLGGACLLAGLWMSWRQSPLDVVNDLRAHVEALPKCPASEVEQRLPAAGGYDCVFSKPVSSGQLLRLQGLVKGPALQCSSLKSPLTQQDCVIYSAAVSRQLHDGMHPVPIAFSSCSTDFVISLTDAPDVQIELRGEDVFLFNMCDGRFMRQQVFNNAPDHWQDFALLHRAATPDDVQASTVPRADGAILEFQECSLVVGAIVTVVGELHRAADGSLSMRPLHDPAKGSGERWRTSWELDGCHPPQPRAAASRGGVAQTQAHIEKVLVSDDPMLMEEKVHPKSLLTKFRDWLS